VDRTDSVYDIPVSHGDVGIAVETDEKRAGSEGMVGVARVANVSYCIDCCSPLEGGRSLHVLLQVSAVFVVVREFSVGVGVGRRLGGWASRAPWLWFGIWAGGVCRGAPLKCLPLNRSDRDVIEESVAPFGW
jgi:hypothetical protein